MQVKSQIQLLQISLLTIDGWKPITGTLNLNVMEMRWQWEPVVLEVVVEFWIVQVIADISFILFHSIFKR